MEFGDRLKRLRSIRGLSVRELARQIGVSASYISQLETNECRPSFSVLKKLSAVLDTTASALIEDHLPEEWTVVRRDRRLRIMSETASMEVEYMGFTGSRDKRIQSCCVRLKPGADGPCQVFTHDRDDLIYILKGSVSVRSAGKEYLLNSGDTAYFSFNRPESFKNAGPDEAAFLWVVSPAR